MDDKQRLRARMRALRREHVAVLPDSTRALLFRRPPGPLVALTPDDGVIGLYHALATEAPTRSYAQWFMENGRTVALPWFGGKGAAMRFRLWTDPYDDAGLEVGPYGQLQPSDHAPEVTPDLVIVPLLAFSAHGDRLGQGGGHYDRWLSANPAALAVGLAWDCQRVDSLPLESHDQPLRAVVTPTRLYEGRIHEGSHDA